MTVRELIEELEQYPMDLPVVNDNKEITEIDLEDAVYYLDLSPFQYSYSSAVILR